MYLYAQGMGDFLNEMAAMMSQNKSNVSLCSLLCYHSFHSWPLPNHIACNYMRTNILLPCITTFELVLDIFMYKKMFDTEKSKSNLFRNVEMREIQPEIKLCYLVKLLSGLRALWLCLPSTATEFVSWEEGGLFGG